MEKARGAAERLVVEPFDTPRWSLSLGTREAEAEADARIAKLVEELAARERQLRMADKQRQIRELEAKLGRK